MKYCLGYRFSHRRALYEEERTLLQSYLELTRRKRRRTLTVAWSLLLAFVPLFALMSLLKFNADLRLWYGMTVYVGFVVAPPWAILIARDAKKRYRLLLESEKTADVDVFRSEENKPKQPEYWQEGVAEELAFEGDLVQVPCTGLILNNLQSPKPTFITAEAVTASPSRATPSNADLLPPRLTLLPGATLPQRQLSADELAELKQLAKRLARPKWWAYPLACYFLIKSISFLWNPPTAYVIIHSVVMFVAGLYLIKSLLDMLALGTKLKLDLAEEMVDCQDVEGQSLEILPNSGYVWVTNGEPSKDRRVGKGLTQL